jgi:hypothetical protein
MFSKKTPNFENKYNVSRIFIFVFLWLPAFGWLPEGAITWVVMKIGLIIIIISTLYVWLIDLQTHRNLTTTYFLFLILPFFITSTIFFVRTVEHLQFTFLLQTVQVLSVSLLILLISLLWLRNTFQSHKKYLQDIYRLGLMKKFDILDEEKGKYNPVPFYPGLDGTNPEKVKERYFQKWIFLTIIPGTGIAFFLIRTVPNSVGWILLGICVAYFVLFAHLSVKLFAELVQIREWEKKINKKLYVND